MVTPLVIRLGPPLSVSVRAWSLNEAGFDKVNWMLETGVFRGLGVGAVIDVTAVVAL